MVESTIIQSKKIIETIYTLNLRIRDRFPHSSLLGVGENLYQISRKIDEDIRWIENPNYFFRVFVLLIILAFFVTIGYSVKDIHPSIDTGNLGNIIQMLEAGLNIIVLTGAAIIFLVSIETRTKRKRVIKAINRLRSIAHLIDMHQLTKDPELQLLGHISTQHSPKRELSSFELSRYLDYCAEMLSLTSKVGFLYVQKFDDTFCINAMNELEELTIGMSSKIWQKIAQIYTLSQK